jgi:hypothetical protein
VDEQGETRVKQLLREARLKILEAQTILRPTDDRWFVLDDLLSPIEEIIIKIKKHD